MNSGAVEGYAMSAGSLPPAAQALAAALVDDPFYATLVMHLPVGSAQRLATLGRYFAYAVEEAPARGRLTLADPPADGAAVWLLPEEDATRRARERAKHQALHTILGPEGFARYAAMVAAMEQCTAPVVPAGSWYLSILGVFPEQQGRGIGAALLRPTIAEADACQAPCYLETFGERTLPFYRRAGFVPVAAPQEPLTGARYWVLCRRPE
jgi:GNAT superfamily N-acetyltransferase